MQAWRGSVSDVQECE